MELAQGKKVYFLSDFHLGVPNHSDSLVREKKIVQFLHQIKHDAQTIIIVGDMFDFWFEYKYVVPKGFVRILGTLAQLVDEGIQIDFFVGNHDMWMKNYLTQELGIKVYFEPQVYDWNNKKIYVGHGDGLGPKDYGYKFLKKIFRNKICQFLFGFAHPFIGIGVANYFSHRSKLQNAEKDNLFLGEEEWLIVYARQQLAKHHLDFFIFGHRHWPAYYPLNEKSVYVNIGDWIKHFTYAVFDGENMHLKHYNN